MVPARHRNPRVTTLETATLAAVSPGRIHSSVNRTTGSTNISTEIGRCDDEVEVSIRPLEELSLLDEWDTNATYREFMRARYPEVKSE